MLNDRFETSTVARIDKCQGAPPFRGRCDLRSGDGHAGGRSLAELPTTRVCACVCGWPRRAIWGQRTLLVAYRGPLWSAKTGARHEFVLHIRNLRLNCRELLI